MYAAFLTIAAAAVLAGAQQLPFRVEMTPARLSNHQRLVATIAVRIDRRELAKRNGEGRLDSEIDIVDRHGRHYPSRGSIELKDVNTENTRTDFFYSQDFFVIPGSYTAYVSVSDTVSDEGGTARHTFAVPPLTPDPLSRAWRDLPAIEFLPNSDAPERWYQPTVNGRLHLTVDTSRPVKIEILVNATATEAGGVSGTNNDMNLAMLIPALKTMAQINPLEGTLDLSMLDLTRRRVMFAQSAITELNWESMREALKGANPNVVDVKSLANRQQRAEFFLDEVARRVKEASEPDEPLHILIVLSGPMVFEDKVSLHPIATTGNENCKVYYFRYTWGVAHPDVLRAVRVLPGVMPNTMPRPIPVPGTNNRNGTGAASSRGGQMTLPTDSIQITVGDPGPHAGLQDDYLEATLRPLKPRLFHVDTPMGFRRAIADLLAEIGKQ